MKKLFYLSPNYNDACSYYRGMGPFSRLRDVQVNIPKDSVSWSTVIGNDAAFLQRPCTEQHANVAGLIAKQRLPIWIDYDDDLINVPLENPAYAYFSPLQKHIEKIVKTANILTTTTPELAELYQSINPNLTTIVVPNAWDDFLWGSERKERNTSKIIFWRGSDSHIKDLMEVSQQIVDVSKLVPEYQFVFMGMNPWFLDGQMPYGYIKPIDIMDYFGFLNSPEWNPEITIVPLSNNVFNSGKSNISWIEATACNSVAVVPEFLNPFKDSPIKYVKTEEFGSWLYDTIKISEEDKASYVEESWGFIKQNLLLSSVNKLRQEIINDL